MLHSRSGRAAKRGGPQRPPLAQSPAWLDLPGLPLKLTHMILVLSLELLSATVWLICLYSLLVGSGYMLDARDEVFAIAVSHHTT